MVGIITQGRLGNQMFQYAFMYAASKKLNTSFFIFNYNSLHYFKLHNDLEKNNTKNILKYSLSNLLSRGTVNITIETFKKPIKWLFEWSIYKNICTWKNTTDKDKFLLSIFHDNTLYDGFFQSEDYFADISKEIIELFEIKPRFQLEFWQKKNKLFSKKVIAIHIRRTDYLNFGTAEMGGKNMTLPISYYKKCLFLIEDIEQYNIIFISDDIAFTKSQFPHKANYFYENNDEIIDFQILLVADILIIANSTFSWWAAWLNNKNNKIIYAPNYFLGFKIGEFYPAGIKVKSWKWIDVN